MVVRVFDARVGRITLGDRFGHDADGENALVGGVKRGEIPRAAAVEDAAPAVERGPAADRFGAFARAAVKRVGVPVGTEGEEGRVRLFELIRVDAVIAGRLLPFGRGDGGVIFVDDVYAVAEQPGGEVQRAFVLVVAVHVVDGEGFVILVVEPGHELVRAVHLVVTGGIVADRPRHGAVFRIGVRDIADAVVVGGIRIVGNARTDVRFARPAGKRYVVAADGIGGRRDGIARREGSRKRCVFIIIERIVAHGAADVYDVRRTALRAVFVHIVDGAARILRVGVGIAQAAVFGVVCPVVAREEIAVVREAERRKVFGQRVNARRFAFRRLETPFMPAGAGIAHIGDGIADRAAGIVFGGKNIRIRAHRLTPYAVGIVFIPVDVVG